MKQEKEALKQATEEVENLKKAYKIENKMYGVEHISDMIFRIETSSSKGAIRRAYQQYKRLIRRGDSYELFKQNTTIIGDIE